MKHISFLSNKGIITKPSKSHISYTVFMKCLFAMALLLGMSYKGLSQGSIIKLTKFTPDTIIENIYGFGFSTAISKHNAVALSMSSTVEKDTFYFNFVYFYRKDKDGNWTSKQRFRINYPNYTSSSGWVDNKIVSINEQTAIVILRLEQKMAVLIYELNAQGDWYEKELIELNTEVTPIWKPPYPFADSNNCAIEGDSLIAISFADDKLTLDGGIQKQGVVHVIEKNKNGEWEYNNRFTPSAGSDMYFLANVDISEGKIYAGIQSSRYEGRIFEYTKQSDGQWEETGFIDNLGVAFSVYKNTALVGLYEYGNDNQYLNIGLVVFYERDSLGVWNEIQRQSSPDSSRIREYFGYSVAIFNGIAAISTQHSPKILGATRKNFVYLFRKNKDGSWDYDQKLESTSKFQYSIDEDPYAEYILTFGKSLSFGSNVLMVNSPSEYYDLGNGKEPIKHVGAIYIYDFCAPEYKNITDTACTYYSLDGQVYTQSGIYEQKIINDLGCDVDYKINLTIIPPKEFVKFDSVCAGSSYSFAGMELTQAGIYKDTIQSTSGCDSIITLHLNHYPPINAQIQADSNILTASPSDMKYQWLDCNRDFHEIVGDTSQAFEIQQNGNYAVEITDKNGCREVSPCVLYNIQKGIFIPNSFSPNADGLNDVFMPVAEGWIVTKMTIFNRWGELVYEKENPETGWDGTIDGLPATDGVYVARIVFQSSENPVEPLKKEIKSASFHLLR